MTLLEEIKGLTWWNEVNKLKSILLRILVSIFEDAPENGNQYGRQDGGWTQTINLTDIEELLNIRRKSGIYTFTSDGVSTVYTFPHELETFPSFVGATRGISTDFEPFNTTWDATTTTITYQNPPLAGEINLNWVAIS